MCSRVSVTKSKVGCVCVSKSKGVVLCVVYCVVTWDTPAEVKNESMRFCDFFLCAAWRPV